MAISADARRRLVVGLTDNAVGAEVADAIDAASFGNVSGDVSVTAGGVATLTPVSVSALASASPTTKIGYLTGAGGTVTQITTRATGVVLSKLTGMIQTDTTSLAAEVSADFIVTNTTVAIGDVIALSIQSGSNGGNTAVTVTTVTNGTFTIKVSNNNAAGGTAETGAIKINYIVLKAVAA